MTDIAWRLALENAKNAERGTYTRGRALYEAERLPSDPADYLSLSRTDRRRIEYNARHNPKARRPQ